MSEAKKADLVAIARGYVDELTRRADEIEQTRHLPQDIADRMTRDGLYHVCVPREYGGSERSPRIYAEVVETLATGDASAAWCVFIGITSTFSIASGQTETARELLTAPGMIASGAFAPSGRAVKAVRDGVSGYVVNGRWQWGSGSRNSTVIGGGVFVADQAGNIVPGPDGKPQFLLVNFLAKEVDLLDTWTVTGLQGTGSTDYQVKDVFVPEGRAYSFGAPKPSYPIFLFPNFGILSIGIGAVALGSARAAINDFLEFAGSKVPQGGTKALSQRQTAQKDLAKAEAAVRSGRAFFYEAIDAAWAAALKGEMSIDHKRDLRLATTNAVHLSRQAVALIFELAGGTAVYRRSPLQRRFRDIHVAAQHVMVNQATYETMGRLLFGLETDTSLY
ncbi:MAG TPA: acyl-CoA dehydrogenase family protein [Parvibaculum sp.]